MLCNIAYQVGVKCVKGNYQYTEWVALVYTNTMGSLVLHLQKILLNLKAVSYTHLTLPTNREV